MDRVFGEDGRALLGDLMEFDCRRAGLEPKREMQTLIERFVDMIAEDTAAHAWRRQCAINAIASTMVGWYSAAATALEIPLSHSQAANRGRPAPSMADINTALEKLRRAPARSGSTLYYEGL